MLPTVVPVGKTLEASELYLKLLGETARVRWSELTVLFERGALIRIVSELDLVSVAEAMARDDAQQIAGWAAAGLLEKMPAHAAADYEERDTELWAVVVSPWVLVQDRGLGNGAAKTDVNLDAES